MVHGGHGRRRWAERTQPGRYRPKASGVDKKLKLKPKNVSLKNQIRSIERMLRKDLPSHIREAQEKKLEGIKKEQDAHTLKAKERKIFLRNRKIKFFERRKIERMIRRIERQQRTGGTATDPTQETELAQQLSKLKADLEYVKFFPKTFEYVPLFVGGDNEKTVERRDEIRKLIKARIVSAAESGKDLEETGSEDDVPIDASDDDFFMSGSSSDVDADDELSTREQASSASCKAASGMSSDEKTQRQISARALMPPPRSLKRSIPSSQKGKKVERPLDIRSSVQQRSEMSTSSTTSNSYGFSKRGSLDQHTGYSDNVGSNSDARKPKRKRRPKKKKQKA